MTTDRKIAIGAVVALVIYAGIDIGFHVKDKLAQARVDGANQVREQAKKDIDAQIAANDKKYDTEKAALQSQIDQAQKTIEGMATLVNKQVPAAPKGITVNTGQPYTVTLQTGDSIVPAESAPAYFNAFEDGQKCQTDLAKCAGDFQGYKAKYTYTQDQYDAEKTVKRRSKWSVLGEAVCAGGGAYLGSLVGKQKGAAIGGAVAGGVCGFKF